MYYLPAVWSIINYTSGTGWTFPVKIHRKKVTGVTWVTSVSRGIILTLKKNKWHQNSFLGHCLAVRKRALFSHRLQYPKVTKRLTNYDPFLIPHLTNFDQVFVLSVRYLEITPLQVLLLLYFYSLCCHKRKMFYSIHYDGSLLILAFPK